MGKKYLVIDNGGTEIKYAMMDENYNISDKGSKPSPTPQKGGTKEDYFNTLDSIVKPVLDEIEGIAVSMPGRIDPSTGHMYSSGAIVYLSGCDFYDECRQRYGDIKVSIENDAKAAIGAEYAAGALKGIDFGAAVIIGTGLGGGLVLNGKIMRGYNMASGEISNLQLDKEKFGTWKGAWAMTSGAAALCKRVAKAKGMSEEETKKFNGIQAFELINNGDKEAVAEFENWAMDLAQGIFNIQVIVDVQRYVIGGGISRQPILIETLNKKMDEIFKCEVMTMYGPGPVQRPEIVACKFNNDANLIGALSTFKELYEN